MVSKSPLISKQSAYIYAAGVAGLCSIVYELLIATTVSYFLGDSVRYFSFTIGLYMAAMGLGAYLSRFVGQNVFAAFVTIEIMLAVLGGSSVPVLYFAYSMCGETVFLVTFVLLTLSVGLLIGLEIPFLTRLLERYGSLKTTVSTVLSLDYVGALVATFSFPLILLPWVGVYASSLLFGLVNLSIGIVLLWSSKRRMSGYWLMMTAAFILLFSLLMTSSSVLRHWDSSLYRDRIVTSEQSIYQKIVLTHVEGDTRLYLNGNLQFSSVDEARYHEALVHIPIFSKTKGPARRVLVLGAGDGLAVRELLKHKSIDEIVVVELDERMIRLAISSPYISQINEGSLEDSRVHIIYDDAHSFLVNNTKNFDFIIADLPDPNNHDLSRLYSQEFYRLVRRNLHESGIFVTQATSPFFARAAFWSIHDTVDAAGFAYVSPLQVLVPSFGLWGFVIGSNYPIKASMPTVDVPMLFVNEDILRSAFLFGKDVSRPDDIKVNKIDNAVLLNYYLAGWGTYYR